MKNDERVLRAIKATEEWISKAKNKDILGALGGYTIYGCELRNLEEYKQILGKDKRRLTGRLRELYHAI